MSADEISALEAIREEAETAAEFHRAPYGYLSRPNSIRIYDLIARLAAEIQKLSEAK